MKKEKTVMIKTVRELMDMLNEGDKVLVIHGNNWLTKGSTSDISLISL